MDDLDFSASGRHRTVAPPAPAQLAPKQVYNAAMAMEFFRSGGKAEAAAAGTRFFEENEKAGFLKRDKMYLVVEGEVALSARGKPVGSVKIGEIFGEMGAISDAPRTATAVAKTDCRVIALDDKEFQKALKVKPEFALMLMGMMILRLRGMLAKLPQGGASAAEPSRESRVFDKNMLAALAKGLGADAIMRHAAGAAIFREGSAGVLMYVVLEGRVALSRQAAVVDRAGPGGVFGEMALVDQAARTASAAAETDCALIAVNRNVFLNLIKANPEFAAALLGAVAERVRSVAALVK